MGITDSLTKQGFLTTSVDALMEWGRTGAAWLYRTFLAALERGQRALLAERSSAPPTHPPVTTTPSTYPLYAMPGGLYLSLVGPSGRPVPRREVTSSPEVIELSDLED